MVLVDGDHVEAELLCVGELVDLGLLLLRAFLRIVERVRQHHPAGAMLVPLRHVERPIRHEMEEGELHACLPPRKPRILCAVMSAFSMCGRCPHRGMSSTFAPGTRSRQSSA